MNPLLELGKKTSIGIYYHILVLCGRLGSQALIYALMTNIRFLDTNIYLNGGF